MTISQMVDATLAFPEDTKLMILAPVVVNRKGEQLELFVELRAKGFVRVRVDGTVHEIDAVPRLAKNTKHTIEVVVDRLRVRADMKQRLAESYETALRNGDGRAIAVEMETQRGQGASLLGEVRVPDLQLLARRARAAPLLVQQSDGRVPALRRLGSISFFDPKRVVAFPQLSLASGAIKGWDRRNQFYFQMLGASRSTSASTSSGRSRLPERVQQILLYGSGDEKIPFAYLSDRGKPTMREHAFEGIIPNLERRYRETDSQMVREELAKYLNSKPCPECDGTRLRREARFVKVGTATMRARSSRSRDAAARGRSSLRAHGPRRPEAGDRRPDRQGDREPARVPQQRRPRLSRARPLGGDALRRRVAAHPARSQIGSG
jgi:excinuclease ABC subunit A